MCGFGLDNTVSDRLRVGHIDMRKTATDLVSLPPSRVVIHVKNSDFQPARGKPLGSGCPQSRGGASDNRAMA